MRAPTAGRQRRQDPARRVLSGDAAESEPEQSGRGGENGSVSSAHEDRVWSRVSVRNGTETEPEPPDDGRLYRICKAFLPHTPFAR